MRQIGSLIGKFSIVNLVFDCFSLTEFIYCGNILKNDNQLLQDYGIRPNTMIHIFQKHQDIEYKSEKPTTEQIQKAVSYYRSVFKEMANSSITVS